MPAIRHGQFEHLRDLLKMFDPTLEVWIPYMNGACRYLSRSNFLNVLYQVQLLMKVMTNKYKCTNISTAKVLWTQLLPIDATPCVLLRQTTSTLQPIYTHISFYLIPFRAVGDSFGLGGLKLRSED